MSIWLVVLGDVPIEAQSRSHDSSATTEASASAGEMMTQLVTPPGRPISTCFVAYALCTSVSCARAMRVFLKVGHDCNCKFGGSNCPQLWDDNLMPRRYPCVHVCAWHGAAPLPRRTCRATPATSCGGAGGAVRARACPISQSMMFIFKL